MLRRLASSALGAQLVVCIRRDRDSGEPVQASIALMDAERGQLYQLVQGIDRAKVAAGHNLFVATVYEMAAFGARNGVREVNLGRGATEQKVHLGANRLHLLDNWIRAPAAALPHIRRIAERCARALQLDGSSPPVVGGYEVR